MRSTTHVALSLAVMLPVMALTNTLNLESVVSLSLGALLPDIDEPHSWIGRRTRGVSDVINKVVGHRGVTHSLVAVLFLVGVEMAVLQIVALPFVLLMYFASGYLLHLTEDSFSKSGVAWLLPFSDRSFQFGFHIFYYTTGGMVENVILILSFVLIGVQMKL